MALKLISTQVVVEVEVGVELGNIKFSKKNPVEGLKFQREGDQHKLSQNPKFALFFWKAPLR